MSDKMLDRVLFFAGGAVCGTWAFVGWRQAFLLGACAGLAMSVANAVIELWNTARRRRLPTSFQIRRVDDGTYEVDEEYENEG